VEYNEKRAVDVDKSVLDTARFVKEFGAGIVDTVLEVGILETIRYLRALCDECKNNTE